VSSHQPLADLTMRDSQLAPLLQLVKISKFHYQRNSQRKDNFRVWMLLSLLLFKKLGIVLIWLISHIYHASDDIQIGYFLQKAPFSKPCLSDSSPSSTVRPTFYQELKQHLSQLWKLKKQKSKKKSRSPIQPFFVSSFMSI
jgi:hypothetical protein